MRSYISATLAILSTLAALFLILLLFTSLNHFQFFPLHLGPLGLLFRSNHGILLTTLFSSADWLPVSAPIDWSYTLLGFGLIGQSAHAPAYTLLLPHWFLILALLIYPYFFFRRTTIWLSHRRQRLALGQCPTCSYDLRMHKPGDRCPECGTLVIMPRPSPNFR